MVPKGVPTSNERCSTSGSIGRSGVTVIELLIVTAIFVVVLAALGAMLTSSLTAYRVTSERSEAIQDAESVEQLLRYEIGRAGFRGVTDDEFGRSLARCPAVWPRLGTGVECASVIVERFVDADGLPQDAVTVRFFEDGEFSGQSDEMMVSYSVDAGASALQRTLLDPEKPTEVIGEVQLLVGNVQRLEVTHFIDRDRTFFRLQDVISGNGGPQTLAGAYLTVTFVGGTSGNYLIGFHNPQVYFVEQVDQPVGEGS